MIPTPVTPKKVPSPNLVSPSLLVSSPVGSVPGTQSDKDGSDSDSEYEEGFKVSQRKAAKRSWSTKMFDCLEEVQRLVAPELDKADSWWGLKSRKSSSHDYPILPVKDQLNKRVEMHFSFTKRSKKKFQPLQCLQSYLQSYRSGSSFFN